MENGDIALIKTEAIPGDTKSADFITNSRYVLVRANSVDGTLVGYVLSTSTGSRFFKFERAEPSEFVNYAMPTAPGAYMEISAGASLRDNQSVKMKPGMHALSAITRICHKKDLRLEDEQLWKSRARLLYLIAQYYETIEAGLYEITTPAPRQPRQTINISDQQAKDLNKFLQQKLLEVRRTSATDRDLLVSAVAGLYRGVGKPAPQVFVVGNPLTGAVAAGLAIGLIEWTNDKEQVKSSITRSAGLLNVPIRRLFQDRPDPTNNIWLENPLIQDRRLHEGFYRLRQNLDLLVGPSSHDWQPTMKQFEIEIEDTVCAITKSDPAGQASLAADSAKFADSEFGLSNYDLLDRLSQSCATRLSQGSDSLKEFLIASVHRARHAMVSRDLIPSDVERDWIAKNILQIEPTPKNSDWETLNQQCSCFWLHENFCIVSQHPASIKLDQHGQAHCADGPAIVWRDGFSQYFLNGISVTRQIVEFPHTLSVQRIVEEPNVEFRRLLIWRYGDSKFLMECGAEKVHEDQFGTLFRKELPPDEPLQMVRVINSTADADGTFKRYYLRVPPQIATAREAVAWTFGLASDQYEPIFES